MQAFRLFYRVLLLVVSTVAALRGLAAATADLPDDYPRQLGIDAIHYVFGITLSDDTDEILGESEAHLRFVEDGVTSFFLDLAMVTAEREGKGMTVSSVSSAGMELSFVHEDDRLRVTLNEAPAKGELRRFTIRYRGIAASALFIGPNRHGDRTFFSMNWPNRARQWLPVIDHPSDKATSEWVVTAPIHYQVVANGLLQEETDLGNGNRRTHWKQSVPIATWLNALGVARFTARTFAYVDGIPLQTWVFPQDRDAGMATFEVPVRRSIEFFSSHVGPYSYEKLANVQAAGMGGGMEHASVIFYGERSVSMQPATSLVAHEIAHQWFGNSVTESDWDDVWLSEGFATYFTNLYFEHYEGRDAFVARLVGSRESVFAAEARRPEATVIHDDLPDVRQIFNGLQYGKGGWVLHTLRGEIGTDAFWGGIRAYYARHQNGLASTDDLEQAMEDVSGRELGWFFDQWLRTPTSPVIEGTWTYDAARSRVVVDLAQTQSSAPFRFSLDIGIEEAGDTEGRVERVEMTERSQRFEIAVAGAPTSVVLDPNVWLLANMSLEGS